MSDLQPKHVPASSARNGRPASANSRSPVVPVQRTMKYEKGQIQKMLLQVDMSIDLERMQTAPGIGRLMQT